VLAVLSSSCFSIIALHRQPFAPLLVRAQGVADRSTSTQIYPRRGGTSGAAEGARSRVHLRGRASSSRFINTATKDRLSVRREGSTAYTRGAPAELPGHRRNKCASAQSCVWVAASSAQLFVLSICLSNVMQRITGIYGDHCLDHYPWRSSMRRKFAGMTNVSTPPRGAGSSALDFSYTGRRSAGPKVELTQSLQKAVHGTDRAEHR
jgi:hypothetical protein